MVEINSLEAFKKIERLITPRQSLVYKYLFENPGSTDQEVKKGLGFEEPNKVRPRRKDLVDLGLVESHGKRECEVTSMTAEIWRVTPKVDLSKVELLKEKIRRKKKLKTKVCPLCNGKGFVTVGQKKIMNFDAK